MKRLRNILWRILGFDYQMMLSKTDYVLLKNDQNTKKGQGTYDNGAKVWRWTNAELIIGNYCSIAHNVNFIVDAGYHTLSAITNYPHINDRSTNPDLVEIRNNTIQKEGITVGHDVWIGLNSIILPGIKIGNGATIAAGSVVTKDVPHFALVAGNPAKIVRMKHSAEEINRLLEIAWWNWSEEKINRFTTDFYLTKAEFIKRHHEN
ncbi:CatB-related O-acetyltransferase [Kaistella sp.]|uniref:CatB-related O-acetyltransferase n=1 Tax=Kaistella sp. TaxID=2782235 RepID=UPI002F94D5E0